MKEQYKSMLQEAASYFGIKKIKPFQRKVCSDLEKGFDVIGLSQTGDGKGLCSQIQSYLHPKKLMLIITPTISLMQDQLTHWPRGNIIVACLYSGSPDKKDIYKLLKEKKINVLYISPERLEDPQYRKALQGNVIHTVVIDEVHCLIEWGNVFRPMYRKIGEFIKKIHPRPLIAAFSATVARKDVNLISDSLGMKNYRVHIGKLRRENLVLKKQFVKTDSIRYEKVWKAVRKYLDKGRIVIYCTRIQDTEDMYEYLTEECKLKRSDVAVCHSKLNNRETEEKRFRTGHAKIMVATSAFGMGIDIPDIRLVIVSQMPFSVASYYQMVGRAGRDGKKAHGILLYNDSDYHMNLDIIHESDEQAMNAVDEMLHLCESNEDIQDQVMEYLGWEE